jgi:hypothetical protein
MEAALAMRSVERTVEEVLLPSVAELARRNGTDSAAWAIGSRWAIEWLRRAQRMTPPPMRPGAILIGDATEDDLDVDAPVVRALELFTGRAGIRIAAIPVRNHSGVGDLLQALRPGAVVIAGRSASDEEIARFAYAVRSAGGQVPVALFHRGDAEVSRTSSVHALPASPAEATAQALALLDGHGAPIRLTGRSSS